LGYDSSSARRTPSVTGALGTYLDQLSRIAGATAVTTKNLKAYTWSPPQVIADKTHIIEALEALVTAANGTGSDQSAPGSAF
jgi:hypothetical protein